MHSPEGKTRAEPSLITARGTYLTHPQYLGREVIGRHCLSHNFLMGVDSIIIVFFVRLRAGRNLHKREKKTVKYFYAPIPKSTGNANERTSSTTTTSCLYVAITNISSVC